MDPKQNACDQKIRERKKRCLLQILTNIKVVKCGCTCVVCDQPKSARTHAHRAHILKVFSHAHTHVQPHIERARTFATHALSLNTESRLI